MLLLLPVLLLRIRYLALVTVQRVQMLWLYLHIICCSGGRQAWWLRWLGDGHSSSRLDCAAGQVGCWR